MPVVTWKKENRIAVMEMCKGPNRMNQVFSQDFNHCLDQIQEDTDIQAMVLTSADEKNFSQGIDVEWIGKKIQDQDNDTVTAFMYDMNRIFKRLLLFPVPVVAAVNGHAFGNGAILSCACDFRFMKKDRGFFCFPEVDVGIPFLPGMIAFVRKAVPEPLFNRMILSGQRMTADDLKVHNVIIKACGNQETLMTEALAFAAAFDKKRGIFRELKQRMHRDLIQVMEEQDPVYIDALNLFVAE
mgnify:FL=1